MCPTCPGWEDSIFNPNRQFDSRRDEEFKVRQCTYGLKDRFDGDGATYCSLIEGHTTPHITCFGDTELKYSYWVDLETPAEKLLRRLLQWDMWDKLADGNYWKGEIEKVLEK